MTFGEQNSEAEGHAQKDYAVDRGINIFDAAEIYPVPPKSETQGRTESIIGAWLARKNKRDKILIATKIAGRGTFDWLREERSATRQSPAQIRDALGANDLPLGRRRSWPAAHRLDSERLQSRQTN